VEVGFGAWGFFGALFWVCAIFYVYSFWVFKGFALGGCLFGWVGLFLSCFLVGFYSVLGGGYDYGCCWGVVNGSRGVWGWGLWFCSVFCFAVLLLGGGRIEGGLGIGRNV